MSKELVRIERMASQTVITDEKEIDSILRRLLSIIAERCGKTVKQVAKVTMHDSYFDAEGAIKFGLVSAVVDNENFDRIAEKGA